MQKILNVMVLTSLVTVSGLQCMDAFDSGSKELVRSSSTSPAHSVANLSEVGSILSIGQGPLPVEQWLQMQRELPVDRVEECDNSNQFSQFGAFMGRISAFKEQINTKMQTQQSVLEKLIHEKQQKEQEILSINEQLKKDKEVKEKEFQKKIKQARGSWVGCFARYGLFGAGCFGLGWAAKSGALAHFAQRVGIPKLFE